MDATKTVERGGVTMDKYSARIFDNLTEEFERVPHWDITDMSSIAINRNRHFDIEFVGEHGSSNKVDNRVLEAIRRANLEPTGFYYEVEGEDMVRVWVEST